MVQLRRPARARRETWDREAKALGCPVYVPQGQLDYRLGQEREHGEGHASEMATSLALSC